MATVTSRRSKVQKYSSATYLSYLLIHAYNRIEMNTTNIHNYYSLGQLHDAVRRKKVLSKLRKMSVLLNIIHNAGLVNGYTKDQNR